ncbi:hypothetical protein REJ26_004347 [Providencia stuartii]|uniref:hypothetical protein n=1 Tax=Enterobacterales TaxID=91347 RepID=UPI0027E97E44|nr:hypothetical protein [Providencia sp. 2023EL-00965]ELR5084485.1 hypothetical protein [Providencia stuartii]ELR5302485.1 hypothetical protein [Providencia stuartii]MDW7590943.1 hypothetical protein [Providencia sp. 2023EL-00965]
MNYVVGGAGLFGLVMGFLILYLIYFLIASTLNIIGGLFKEQSVKNDLMNEYKKDNKDI